ncbi:MAG: class I SAM-dependent methyltransferase [Anaerolineae bacterium]|nr:class I SAM-dependent methyltransferase [Anaerolineae bacterium]MCA9892487.1 class I SAM-dependent methyltransferase [Anaerolineae bacterium]
MDAPTTARLNAINREFYETTATEFDATRGKAWPGWEALLPYLPDDLSVLDVGCGNGRFAIFLAEQGRGPFRYHGMDNNPALLDYARSAVEAFPSIEATFEQRDIVTSPPDEGIYSLVVLFGVIHHIPGADNRQRFIATLAERVVPGGILAVASWRFYEYERFRKRLAPWPDDLASEPHDYLLDWRRGERALRYCHYVDDAEQSALIAATGLHELTTYRADGFTNAVNCYSLLQRTP